MKCKVIAIAAFSGLLATSAPTFAQAPHHQAPRYQDYAALGGYSACDAYGASPSGYHRDYFGSEQPGPDGEAYGQSYSSGQGFGSVQIPTLPTEHSGGIARSAAGSTG